MMMYTDEQLGVRIVRPDYEISDPNEVVVVQIKDEKRGWVDFYRMKWVDLAHGRVTVETLGANAQDHFRIRRVLRAVAMAASKYERDTIRDLWTGGR